MAIIDAGSTSSRLFIYKWDKVPDPPTLDNPADPLRYDKPIEFLSPELNAKKKVAKKGIHDVYKDGDNMDNYLKTILVDGATVLQPLNIADGDVPLYVMGTAGVRSADDPDAIMVAAWNAIRRLQAQGGNEILKVFGINNALYNSFVVDRELEGVYAWIALNHGRYQPDQLPGILELGGQSMQIAFADPADINQGDDFRVQVCLFRSRHKLQTLSWDLGAEVSRREVENELIKADRPLPRHGHHDLIYNPCLPHHEELKITTSTGDTIVTGSGDFPKCLALAQSRLDHFNFSPDDDEDPIPLPPLDVEPFTKRFYGVSSFYYTWEFFSRAGHYSIHSAYDPKLFRQAVDDYCNGSWLQPFAWNENGVRDDGNVHRHCFAAAWMMALFHSPNGFNLRLSDYDAWKGLIRFPPTEDFGGRSSWTIGVATMVARNGAPRVFCGNTEGDMARYPPPPAAVVDNATPVNTATPVVVPLAPAHFPLEFTQPIPAPSTPSVVVGSLLTNFPLSSLDPVSTFSGLGCGILLFALVLIGYRRFSARPVQSHMYISFKGNVRRGGQLVTAYFSNCFVL